MGKTAQGFSLFVPMEKDQIDNLAAKIAEIIANDSKPTELSALHATIVKLNQRLDRLESQHTFGQNPIQAAKTIHPSHETFKIAEAIADTVFGRNQAESTCGFEPRDKPSDNCSMCSSRGF